MKRSASFTDSIKQKKNIQRSKTVGVKLKKKSKDLRKLPTELVLVADKCPKKAGILFSFVSEWMIHITHTHQVRQAF